MNSSEFYCMLVHAIVPEFMRRALGGELKQGHATEGRWNQLCKQYHQEALNGQVGTWHMVILPFGLSMDNAAIHTFARRRLLLPRVPLLEQATQQFTQADAEFGVMAALQDRNARRLRALAVEYRWQTQAQESQTTRDVARYRNAYALRLELDDKDFVQMYVDIHMRRVYASDQLKQEIAEEILAAVMQPYTQAVNRFKADSPEGASWEHVFLRRMALRSSDWWCLLPEQMMPLGNTTPDIHQSAELLVRRSKLAMQQWATDEVKRDPRSHELTISSAYDNALHADSIRRNVPDEAGLSPERRALHRSIRRSWLTFQILAEDKGKAFQPQPLPRDSEPEYMQHVPTNTPSDLMGTAGGWPPSDWS
jgi:hypothetical protein